MRKYAVITILNNLAETSMPYNEFVLYRHDHGANIKQYVVVCDTGNKTGVRMPEDLDIRFVGSKSGKLQKTIKQIIEECERDGLPYVFHLHQIKSALRFNISSLFKGYHKKTLFTIHNQFTAYNTKNKIASVVNALMAGRLTCVSDAAFAAYPGVVRQIKGKYITAIENGVDIERIDNVIEGIPQEKKSFRRFVYIARMIPVKNHELLLDVFQSIKSEYELVLIGAEDKDGAIRKRVNENENLAKHVVMTGPIPRNEVFRLLRNSDVYVSPSRVEGLPVSVLEAMSAHLPVILSNIQPHCELQKGDNGAAVEILPLNTEQWIEKINSCIEEDEDSLRKRGEGRRQIAEQYFSLNAMHDKYYAEYEKLL